MHFSGWVTGLGLGFLVFGCGTRLNPDAQSVRVGKAAPDDMECKELGIIYGSGSSMTSDSEAHLRSAQNDLRNKASALGGNFVIMDIAAGSTGATTISGRALWCSPRHADRMVGTGAPATVGGTTPAATPEAAPQAASGTPSVTNASPVAAAAPGSETAEQRLRTLDDLRKKGLITDDEYQQRRKAVLQSL